jgi:ubiquinone/menaquinone biosynthesis C-methylase UbiE
MYSVGTPPPMARRRSRIPSPRTRGAHVRKNLRLWEKQSASYDRRCAPVLSGPRAMAWGLWRTPESELRAIGNPKDQDTLEVGCGAARWSIALAEKGARAVGLDLSPAQLAHARRLVRTSRAHVRLVRGDAERLPFDGSTFDLVFCDWGAMTFCDPYRTVPEASRVLRLGGRLVFATSSPIRIMAQERRYDRMGRRLRYDYFGMHEVTYRGGEVNFTLPYGEWIALFSAQGLVVESLTETRPPTRTKSRYLRPHETAWARRWPLELIWQVRKSEERHRRSSN